MKHDTREILLWGRLGGCENSIYMLIEQNDKMAKCIHMILDIV